MKHVYPPRHPAWLDDPAGASRPGPPEAAQPPAGKAPAAAPRREIRQARGDAVDGGADTDRGSTTVPGRGAKPAPDRGPGEPRR